VAKVFHPTQATPPATVVDIAEKGGRSRWKIENEGFNRQKNSGLNLCHVYSIDPEKWKAYYYLLQIAFLIMQLCERGSLLKQLAAEWGRTPLQLFGSLKNLARRLLEALRYLSLPEDNFASSLALSCSKTSSTTQSSYSGLKLSPCDFTNSVQASSASLRVE